MADNLITNYNPYASYYNNWMSYPYNMNNMFMPFYGTNNMFQDSLYSNQLFNVPANKADTPAASSSASDAVAFTSNSISKDDKKGSYTGAIIGTGITLAAIAGGLYYLYRRGGGGSKGVKQAIKDGWNDLFKKAPKEPPKNPPVGTEAGSKTKKTVIQSLDKNKAEKLPEYFSLKESVKDVKSKMENGIYGKSDNADELFNSLIEHNYSSDPSYIEVSTRNKYVDFTCRTVDVSNREFYRYRLINTHHHTADMIGNYCIETLPDGKKLVSIAVPSGRIDSVGRPIRTQITVVSKDSEYTPMQKDLIEIISQRKGTLSYSSKADILQLGVLANEKANYYESKKINPVDINLDVLLSSIATAKKGLADAAIDKDFVQKALNGETLKLITHS